MTATPNHSNIAQSNLQQVINTINRNAAVGCNISNIEINLVDLAPSGPRDTMDGTDEGIQEIAYAEQKSDGDIILLVTLLAAGFVIGLKGSSVQKICERSGCSIKSWNTHVPLHSNCKPKAVRLFLIHGSLTSSWEAIRLISAAVDRYKILIEGLFRDQIVSPIQTVEGIDFVYRPPPIQAMPKSARTISIKDYERIKGRQRDLGRSTSLPAIFGQGESSRAHVTYLCPQTMPATSTAIVLSRQASPDTYLYSNTTSSSSSQAPYMLPTYYPVSSPPPPPPLPQHSLPHAHVPQIQHHFSSSDNLCTYGSLQYSHYYH